MNEDDEAEVVEIVRFYARESCEVLRECTLEEAKEHCRGPDASSRTCTTEEGLLRTAQKGPWFEGWRSL